MVVASVVVTGAEGNRQRGGNEKTVHHGVGAFWARSRLQAARVAGTMSATSCLRVHPQHFFPFPVPIQLYGTMCSYIQSSPPIN